MSGGDRGGLSPTFFSLLLVNLFIFLMGFSFGFKKGSRIYSCFEESVTSRCILFGFHNRVAVGLLADVCIASREHVLALCY